MYLGEGEARKQDENASPHDESTVSVASSVLGGGGGGGSDGRDNRTLGTQDRLGGQGNAKMGDQGPQLIKGHEFYSLSFHMPQSCDHCGKPLWALVRPPPAMECR